MHIKQILIQGFKSYRDQIEAEEFSPRHNAVVGRNGAGKSNFFRAIQFVLGEKAFSNLSRKERQEMLHEGAGANVMSAFVEIIFDNSDGRLPVDSQEVVMRRTIGLKKDEYFLNRKHVTKSDVINLLESAGFSRANPYYVVQQGKVNALCLMKDKQRLELLKEVAGTTVYEERRTASQKILLETAAKREKIQEVIMFIEARLNTLREEKQELQEFRGLDRDRRAVEYTLYDQEMHKASRELKRLEVQREQEVHKSNEASVVTAELKETVRERERAWKEAGIALRAAEKEKKALEEEHAQLMSRRAHAEIVVKDLDERCVTAAEQEEAFKKELEALNTRIAASNDTLETCKHEFQTKQDAHQQIADELRTCEARIELLLDKRGRASQFDTQDERDAWLKGEIKGIQKTIDTRLETRTDVEEELNSLRKDVEVQTAQVAQSELDTAATQSQLKELETELTGLQKERDERAGRRKEQWRLGRELDDKARKIRTEYDDAKKALKHAMPHHLAMGLDGVAAITKELNIEGVYGPIFELIKPAHNKFNAAIETAAGNSLMHVVVDTDETAAKLIRELHVRKAGRVTFKPLNQARNHNHNNSKLSGLPTNQTDAVLLISKMKFDSKFTTIMESIFGQVLLCRDAAVAGEFSRHYDVNCVTLEGDEVNRRGAMTGGFVDARKSKLTTVAKVKQCEEELKKNMQEAKHIKDDGQHLDQAVTKAMSDMSNHEMQCGHLRRTYKVMFQEHRKKRARLDKTKQTLAATEAKMEESVAALKILEQRMQAFQTEADTPMLATLSPEEVVELKDLEKRKHALGPLEQTAKKKLRQAKVNMNNTERELRDNLLRRKEELEALLSGIVETATASAGALDLSQLSQESGEGGATAKKKKSRQKRRGRDDDDAESEEEDDDEDSELSLEQRLKNAQDDLKELVEMVEASDETQEALEVQVSKLRKERKEMRDEIQALKALEAEAVETLQEGEERVEKLLTRRGVLLQRREASTQKIRELGSLPTAELDKFSRLSNAQLMEKLKGVNEKLKKYSHVNKKALDQFVNFSDQREALHKRIEELDSGDDAIRELLQHLDRQKDEAIMRTFRSVAQHFEDVFKELVPTGSAHLRMITRLDKEKDKRKKNKGKRQSGPQDDDHDDDEDDDGEEEEGDVANEEDDVHRQVEQFIGVSPKVMFSGGGEVFSMRQLSGGQKALVALTLIFAIQRCDPAPFYLFDEIDQALDSNHRAAVAALVHRQANVPGPQRAQFITTTFRAELVEVADKVYGVRMQNKVSRFERLNHEEGMEFIQQIIAEEESTVAASGAGGTSAAASRRSRPTRDSAARALQFDEADEEEGDEEGEASDGNGASEPATKSEAKTQPQTRRGRKRVSRA